MDPRRLFCALRRRSRTLALSAAVSAALGVILAKTVVPQEYEAQIVLQWEHEKTQGEEDSARELQTLIDSVKLAGNLERVRERLSIKTTIEALARRVDVISSGESNVITLKGRAADGEAAARLVSEVKAAFLDHRTEVERQRLEEQAANTAADVAIARQSVARATKEYDDFRAEHGTADLPVEMRAAIENAARLRSDADTARAEAEAELARMEALRRVTQTEPPTAVLRETEIMPGVRKLAELKEELVGLRAQLASDHPRVQAVEAQIAALEKRVAEAPRPGASDRTVGPNPQREAADLALTQARVQREAARKREDAYLRFVDQTQEVITKLSKIDGENAGRLSSVHVAEKHLAFLEEQLANAKDAARSPTSSFRILAPAKAPLLPVRSLRRVVALGAPALGLLVSALSVLLGALRGLRAFTARELSFWGRAPVVASSTWPRDAEALDDLIVDLDLFLQRSSGVTLVLALNSAEAPHAEALVRRLESRGDPARESEAQIVPAGLTISALRRVARQASRVLVLVESGRWSGIDLSLIEGNLGRSDGFGFVLVGLGADLEGLLDRVGDVEKFWSATVPAPGA